MFYITLYYIYSFLFYIILYLFISLRFECSLLGCKVPDRVQKQCAQYILYYIIFNVFLYYIILWGERFLTRSRMRWMGQSWFFCIFVVLFDLCNILWIVFLLYFIKFIILYYFIMSGRSEWSVSEL